MIEQARQTHAAFLSFKRWLAKRQRSADQDKSDPVHSESGRLDQGGLPTFQEWFASQDSAWQRTSQPMS